MTREQMGIMFYTLMLIIVILLGAVLALSDKYNKLDAQQQNVCTTTKVGVP